MIPKFKIEIVAFDIFVREFQNSYERARTTYFQFYGLRFHLHIFDVLLNWVPLTNLTSDLLYIDRQNHETTCENDR